MTDLRSLLDVPSEDIKKPPVWPVGTYHGFIEKYETGKTKEKQTAYLRVLVRCVRPDEGLAAQYPDFFASVEVNKRTFRKDYYLLEDKSQHWRLKEMLEKVGIPLEGRTMLAAIPELTAKNVKFELSQRANQDNTELFNEIADGGIAAETE